MSVADARPTKIAAATRKPRSNRLGILATQIGILVAMLALWQFAGDAMRRCRISAAPPWLPPSCTSC